MRKFLSKKKSTAIKLAVAAGVCFTGLAQAQATGFSDYFDWRLNNPTDSTSSANYWTIVSPVENQQFGTCWTFGTFGSYESSWFKQLLAAQAAGHNVDLSRGIFSKYYLAWTAFMPPVYNSSDDSVRFALGADDLMNLYGDRDNHPVYDQGGFVSNSVSTLVRYGAIDQSSLSAATTEELRADVLDIMDTQATWNRINNFARNYLATQYDKELRKTVTNATQRNKMVEDYRKSLTDEDIAATAMTAYDNATQQAVLYTMPAKGLLHDTYVTKDREVDNSKNGLTAEQIENTKELIQTEGVVLVTHATPGDDDKGKEYTATYRTTGEVYPFYTEITHAESLVGWDDNYTFQRFINADDSAIKGAFLMRNSWGANYAINGYGYLAYQDSSIADIAFFNAELDSRRYTINTTNAPAVDKVDYIAGAEVYATQNVANAFKANTDSGELLKAVMFYASEANMPYEIIVREGQTPGEGTILTQQSGTFGEDGNAKWGGYRTVDLDKFVFLAKDKRYVVEVRTTSPTGKTVYVALMAGQDVQMDGESYYYDEATQTWIKTDKMYEESNTAQTSSSAAKAKSDSDIIDNTPTPTPTGYNSEILDRNDYKQIYIFTVARNKESSSANGGDFTVSWLDDTGSTGNSVINLGSGSELYGYDYGNPSRKTLSNMTVDLGADIYNFYRGRIIGEGSVTKTGAGFLALNGANTYTGGTFVNNGRLEINGSILGNATVTDSGIISGSGTIGGTLFNRNRAIAGNLVGNGNLTMGGLASTGDLISQAGTKFVVNGSANVNGSTVIVNNSLPDENITVVEANSLTGNIANNAENPKAVSAMLNLSAAVTGNKVIANSTINNNIGNLDGAQAETFNAIKTMSSALQGDSRREELRTVLNLDAPQTLQTFSELRSTDSAQMMALAQRSSVVNRVIADRAATVDQSADLVSDSPYNNNFWVKFTKNWGELKGGTDYHGQGISGGYDHAIGENWRAGLFVSYNASGIGAQSANGNIYDTRFGIYGSYKRDANEGFLYIDGGKIRNKLQRHIRALGLSTDADYNGNIFEIGGEFKHDLQPEKTWHVSPYVNLQFSSLKQNSYSETGAGIFNQHVNSKRNSYFAGQLGVEFKRNFTRGNFTARVGVKHAFTGADPELNFSYEGNIGETYALKSNQDKTHFLISVGGENEFARNWFLNGDLAFQKGGHDRDLSASVMLRKVW